MALMLVGTGALAAAAQDIVTMQLQQGFGKNKVRYKDFDWHVIESEHVELLYEPAFEQLAEMAVTYLEEAYGRISALLRHELSHRPPIVIYQSHYEFEQTNIIREFLPPGVAGFAEPLRYRVVTPFAGDHDEFRRTLTHELMHIFEYDILYRGPIKRLSSPLRSPPTWVMEGLAEYAVGGRNTVDEMVLRDAVLSGTLIPLKQMDADWGYGNTFLMYKQSQSLMEYIAAQYGLEKVSRILRMWDVQADTDKLLERLLDLDMATLDERWSSSLRRQYWPLLQSRDYLSDLGRRLEAAADDDESRAYYNARWSLSGDMLAVLSTDGVEEHVDIVRLSDGSLVERITRGMRVGRFDYLTFGAGTVDWAPDGRTIAFVAKDGARDRILLWDLYDKRLSGTLRVQGVELIESLAWAPDSRRLALVGTGDGQSDVYVLDTETGQVQQITGTPQRDDYPAWSPDGRQLAFSSKRGGQFDIRIRDMDTGETRTVIASPTDDMWPKWLPEGNKLLFVSTREQINDLFLYHLDRNEEYRLTRTLNGVMDPALSPDGRRVVVSTYNRGHSELYVLDMPDWSQVRRRHAELLDRARRTPVAADSAGAAQPAVETPPSGPPAADDRSVVAPRLLAGASASAAAPWTAAAEDRAIAPAASAARPASEAAAVDTLAGESRRVAVAELPRRRYTPKLEFEGVAVQMGYYDGFLASIAQLSMSDLLGDHSLSLATDYVASQEISSDFNFALAYSYYGRRPDFGLAVFNWNTYYNTWVASQAGYLSGVAKTQQTGAIASASYPIDLYRRVELNYTYVGEQEALVWPEEQRGPTSTTHLVKTAYVHDSIAYGLLGPTTGCGFYVAVGHTLGFSSAHRSFTHAEADYRRYTRLGRWSVLGVRGTGVASIGADALEYKLGGPAWWLPFYTGFDLNVGPLRGYRYSEFTGSRVVLLNTEVRVPLVRQIVFGWPATFSIPAVDGSAFADLGTAWNEGDKLDLWPIHDPLAGPDPEGRRSLYGSIGCGALVYFLLPLNFEWAWQTDFRGSRSGYEFHFSFGRTF